MEIKGLSILPQLKKCVRKKEYELALDIAEKWVKRFSFPLNVLQAQILMKQLDAVHGLFEETLTGRVDAKPENTKKLILIINRNILFCKQLFDLHCSRHMIHLQSGQKRAELCQVKSKKMYRLIKKFVKSLLKSCYYIYMTGFQRPVNQDQGKKIKLILTEFLNAQSQKTSKDKNIQMSIVEVKLVRLNVMKLRNQFEQSLTYFFDSVSSLMLAYALSKKKKSRNSEAGERERRKILQLLLLAVINNQRILIEQSRFNSWQVGMGIVKMIENQMRCWQNNWGKYIRKQYQILHIISAGDFQQIKDIFIPFVLSSIWRDQDSLFSKGQNHIYEHFNTTYLKLTTNSNFFNHNHSDPLYGSKFNKKKINKNIKRVNVKNVYQEPAFFKPFSQNATERTMKIKKIVQLQQKYGISCNKFGFLMKEKEDEIEDGQDWERNKKLKRSPSIQSFEVGGTSSCSPLFPKAGQSLMKEGRYLQKKAKLSKQEQKQKKLVFKGWFTKKYEQRCLNSTFDEFSKREKQIIKERQKKIVIHRMIDQDFRQTKMHDQMKRGSLRIAIDEAKEERQLQYSSDLLRIIITKNRVKLKTHFLIEKYELCRKRKKVRNYQIEMLEFELRKNISNYVLNGMPCGRNRDKTIGKRMKNRDSSQIFHFSLALPAKVETLVSQEADKLRENCFKRSKQTINQMLKKIVKKEEGRKIGRKVFGNTENKNCFSLTHSIMD